MEENCMNNFYLLVKDNIAFSAINYIPSVPDDIEMYEITLEDYQNFSQNDYIFNPINKKLEPRSQEELNEKCWIELRAKRNALLSQTDWTIISDNPLTEEQRNLWKIYRQKLRDLPKNTIDPTNVNWPTSPA